MSTMLSTRNHATLLSTALSIMVYGAVAQAWPHEGIEVNPALIYKQMAGPLEIEGAPRGFQVVHVAYVDTWNDEVSFVASRPNDRGLTVSEFAARTGAQLAINANYFDRERASCGLMLGQGELWTDAYHHLPFGRCADSVGFTQANDVLFFDSWDRLNGPPPDSVTDVVTGMPTLIRGGAIVAEDTFSDRDYPPNLNRPNPRTAVCMHDDQRTFVMVIVEGRRPGRRGMSGLELSRFMRSTLGCHEAIALDGGGSSAMFIQGRPAYPGNPLGVINRIAGDGERGLCCHLGVRIETGRPLWRAELVDQSPVPTVPVDASFTLWARYRNTGRSAWQTWESSEAQNSSNAVILTMDEGEPLYQGSLFLDDDWLAPFTPASVEAATEPGELGAFLFNARAPLEPGLYFLTLRPASERTITFDAPPATWLIHVVDEPSPDY